MTILEQRFLELVPILLKQVVQELHEINESLNAENAKSAHILGKCEDPGELI